MTGKVNLKDKDKMKLIFLKESLSRKIIRKKNNRLESLTNSLPRKKRRILEMLNLNRDKPKKINKLKRLKMSK
jgi:hypothetical protein